MSRKHDKLQPIFQCEFNNLILDRFKAVLGQSGGCAQKKKKGNARNGSHK